VNETTSATVPTTELRHLSGDDLPIILKIAEQLRRFVDAVGRFGSWFAMPLILITAFDLFIRKARIITIQGDPIQIWLRENISPVFDSTLLQELEWHSHTALFALVLGFGYIWNTHVRVDLVRETLAFRKKAWLELIGLTVFLVPFTCIIIYYASMYAYDSWAFNRAPDCAWWQCGEISASLVGMSHRWIIKLVLVFGLITALLAGIAVWLQTAVVLFGPQNTRYKLMTLEWPEEEGGFVEGKERMDLEKMEDQLELQARKMREATEAESITRQQ
jgi:TRAP-type mannitol/chloroaromatic compound transport system permease small subunit